MTDDTPVRFSDELYGELRCLAKRKLAGERIDHTLQPTALAHEACLRLGVFKATRDWQGRDHFMAVAAEAMRRVLVDHARKRLADKRGGKYERQPLPDVSSEATLSDTELLAVHEALDSLAAENSVAAELVKLRIFAGFSQIDAAKQLSLGKAKADRVWAFSKARLLVLMGGRPCP